MPGAFDRLRDDALGAPFLLDTDGRRHVIARPALDTLLRLADHTKIRPFLTEACGDQTDTVLAAVAGEDYAVILQIVEDLREFFEVPAAARVRWLLDRYGDAIEADLAGKVDLADLWRGTLTPRRLLNLIDHLPRTSHYQEALSQDDEVAAGLIEAPDGQPKPPPLTEWSPEVEALAAVVERLSEVINAVIVSNGGKAVNSKPWPRPVTAADRVRAQRRQAAMDDLEAQLFPPTA